MRPFNMIYDAGEGEREGRCAASRAQGQVDCSRERATVVVRSEIPGFWFSEICRFPSLSILSYSTLMNALFSPIDFSSDFYHLSESLGRIR